MKRHRWRDRSTDAGWVCSEKKQMEAQRDAMSFEPQAFVTFLNQCFSAGSKLLFPLRRHENKISGTRAPPSFDVTGSCGSCTPRRAQPSLGLGSN